ncbi:MAG: alcohol dehydrogenase catalytic domain-containing protein [Bacteroidetes bacterium]|nr:alcohol dehydrogenase catalytic domain-containing protein [Bacteroidota bacterium]
MKSMKLTGIRQMTMQEIPKPTIKNPTDVLVKMKVVGICGSDVHYYVSGKIGSQVVQYPFTVGHEGAGVVEAVGNAVTRVKKGDPIAIEPAMPCHECDQCKSGRLNTCRHLKFLGCPGQAEGCLSEYIVMPETSCFPVPRQINYDQAALSEPLAIGVYAVRQSIDLKKSNVGILGFGPIGMSVAIAARAKNAEKIYVTDKINERLAKARELNVSYTGNPIEKDIEKEMLNAAPEGMDVVFECSGKQEAVYNAFEVLKPGGKLMLIGIPEFSHWQLPVDAGRRKEITIVNVRRQNAALEDTLDGLANQSLDVSGMPTHRFSFNRTKEGFDLVTEYKDGVMKAMIDFID